MTDPAEREARDMLREEREAERQRKMEADRLAYLRTLDRQTDGGMFADDSGDDVARMS